VLAQGQDGVLLYTLPLGVVDLVAGPAEGTLEDGVGRGAGLEGDWGKVLAEHVVRLAAGKGLGESEAVAEALTDGLEDAPRFSRDLGSNVVAGEYRDVERAHSGGLSKGGLVDFGLEVVPGA
jgi:hypothetical protein